MRASCAFAAALLALVVGWAPPQAQSIDWLGRAQHVADGVDYFATKDRSLTDPAAPIAIFLVRLDPRKARLASVHANDEVMGVEAVDRIARRHGAIAAINGGFFNERNGDPQFVLKQSGELVSDSPAVKGAVIIQSPARGRTTVIFDQLSARVWLLAKAGAREWRIPVNGVNTTRARGRLMLYNSRYHADTDTAPNGVEWVLSGRPLRVVAVHRNVGRTPIPPVGVVLSFGGLNLPPVLEPLTVGALVASQVAWTTLQGTTSQQLEAADDIVAGAGLLRVNGRAPANWEQDESLSRPLFIDARHPRSVVGVDALGSIWLIAIDGRQPAYSAGMTFGEMERLCDRLRLTGALNLDGGGSTTMVVRDRVVNHPADPVGPRPVSDALLVTARQDLNAGKN
jgi:hypothetical protein